MNTLTKTLLLLFVAALSLPASAQSPFENRRVEFDVVPANTAEQEVIWTTSSDGSRKLDVRIMSPVSSAVEALKKAETDDARERAESDLTEALGEEYDQHLDQYAAYLDGLEAKLKKMRAKLEKRRDAKTEMVGLRLQVIKAESNDLGWPGQGTSNRRTFRRPFPAATDPFVAPMPPEIPTAPNKLPR